MPSQIEESLAARFVCVKCHNVGARTRAVSMSGVGLSRFSDIKPYRYVLVSCSQCGYTEVYDYKTVESGGQGLT